MIELHEIQRAVEVKRGRPVDRTSLATALFHLDHRIMVEQTEKRVRWEIWDKQSSLNGVSADQILDRQDVSDGEIYLIYIDDQLTFLQPHVPRAAGFVQMGSDVIRYAQEHVDEIVKEMTLETIVQGLIDSNYPLDGNNGQ